MSPLRRQSANNEAYALKDVIVDKSTTRQLPSSYQVHEVKTGVKVTSTASAARSNPSPAITSAGSTIQWVIPLETVEPVVSTTSKILRASTTYPILKITSHHRSQINTYLQDQIHPSFLVLLIQIRL